MSRYERIKFINHIKDDDVSAQTPKSFNSETSACLFIRVFVVAHAYEVSYKYFQLGVMGGLIVYFCYSCELWER